MTKTDVWYPDRSESDGSAANTSAGSRNRARRQSGNIDSGPGAARPPSEESMPRVLPTERSKEMARRSDATHIENMAQIKVVGVGGGGSNVSPSK